MTYLSKIEEMESKIETLALLFQNQQKMTKALLEHIQAIRETNEKGRIQNEDATYGKTTKRGNTKKGTRSNQKGDTIS